jgi:hypothetical protein
MLALWTQVTFWEKIGYRTYSDEVRAYFAVVLEGKVERKSRDSLSFGTSGDLQTLHDTGETLVLETRVLSFSVFTNDGEVNI